MSDTKILDKLDKLDLDSLKDQQRNCGRKMLSPEFVKEWSKLHLFAKDLIDDEHHSDVVLKKADFLFLITESIYHLEQNPIPRYYSYTDVKILDWFIGKNHSTYKHYKEKCIIGITYLVIDFILFESKSLSNLIEFNQDHKGNIDFLDRNSKLGKVLDDTKLAYKEVFEKDFIFNISIQNNNYKSLNDYVNEIHKVNGLIDFTCFPRTHTHDEYAFLRTIHVSEFCFLGIINSIKEAIDNIRFKSDETASYKCLKHACYFVNILHGIFKVLRTMPSTPVNNFAFFRDETGKASAVQSKNFQEMDVYLRGIDPIKKEVFRENIHLKYLEKFAHPAFTYNFKSTLTQIKESEIKWKKVFEIARELDKKLITWKGLHLGFAYAYLPPEAIGTGATDGAAYLAKFIKSSIFDDTIIDYNIFKEGFSQNEFPKLHEMLFRVDPRIGVSI